MKTLRFSVICILIMSKSFAQKSLTTFIFGHSLINHEYQLNITPSQETSVPHWFYYLSQSAGHSYAVSGQYGFLPQHSNLPPIAQWGFDVVPGAWDSDMESFAEANFSNILITPGNFIQWQAPGENYYNENISPLDATNTIFNWCEEQTQGLTYYVYENWPDMGSYLNNGFPPTVEEWNNYDAYLHGDFHNWFIEYHDSLILAHPDKDIKMIPVGPIISDLLKETPFNQIPYDTLYEDDAPHGRPTTYFLAALITYMAMYEEKAPSNFVVDLTYIDYRVSDNYRQVVDFIWNRLLEFDFDSGVSRVFSKEPVIENSPITQTVVLEQGWNIISLYVEPENTTVTSLFSNAETVKTMDSLFQFQQSDFLNTLKNIETGVGYLIFNSVNETLYITGIPVFTESVSLQTGWNLVGVPSIYPIDVSEFADALIIKNFEGFYEPGNAMSTIDELMPGKAYFVER